MSIAAGVLVWAVVQSAHFVVPATPSMLHLTLPDGWKRVDLKATDNDLPEILIRPPDVKGIEMFSIKIHSIGVNAYSDEGVERIVSKLIDGAKPLATEKDVRPSPIEGNLSGQFVTITLKNAKGPEPLAMTLAFVHTPGMGAVVKMIHRKDAELKQAIDLLRTARVTRPATRPAF